MEKCCCVLRACGLLGSSPATGKATLHQLQTWTQEAQTPPGWKREPARFPSRSPVQRGAAGLGWGIGSRCLHHKDPIIVSAPVLRVLRHSPMGTQQSHVGKAVQIHRGKGSKAESPVPSRVGALWHPGGGCKGYEGPEVPTRCLCSRPSGHSVLRTPGQFPPHLQITLRIRQ